MYGPESGRFTGDPWQPSPGAQATQAAPTLPIPITAPATVSGGLLTAKLGPAKGSGWFVRRITVQYSGSSTGVRAYVYVGDPTIPGNLVSGTNSGTFDECEYEQPLFIPPANSANVQWTTGSGTALARFEYWEV
jgi:hypothetical protein